MLHPGQWSGQQDLPLERYGQILFWRPYIKYILIKVKLLNLLTISCVLTLSGPSANTEERKAAMKVAEQFIKDKNYPKNTQVSGLDLAC